MPAVGVVQSPSGEYSLSPSPGWFRQDEFARQNDADLAFGRGNETFVVCRTRTEASLDELIDQRTSYMETIAVDGLLTVVERRYFYGTTTPIVATKARYSFVLAETRKERVTIVLGIIANGHAYEVIGGGPASATAEVEALIDTFRLLRS